MSMPLAASKDYATVLIESATRHVVDHDRYQEVQNGYEMER